MYSLEKKEKVSNFLKNNQILHSEYCLIGSSLMEEYGIREAGDIDMLVSSSVLKKLKQKENYDKIEIIDGVKCYEYKDIELKENFLLKFCNISDDEIIQNSKYIIEKNGLRFLKPEVLTAAKLARGSKKDLQDANLIVSYFTMQDKSWDVSLFKQSCIQNNNSLEKKIKKLKFIDKLKKKIKNIMFFGKLKKQDFSKKEKTYFFLFIPIYNYLYSVRKKRKKILGLKIWEHKISDTGHKKTFYFLGIPILQKKENLEKYKKLVFLGLTLYKEEYEDFKISKYLLGIKYKTLKNNFYTSMNYIVSPALLLANHYNKGKFDLFDTIVRYLAVAEFNGDNKVGKNLYKKMQLSRGVWNEHNLDTFEQAINSIKAKGFDFNIPIELRGTGQISDGSHRFSIALYYHLPFVSAVPVKWFSSKRNYSIEWFENHNFTPNELEILTQTKDKLFFEYGIYTPIILWGPVKNLYGDITKDIISKYKVKIVKEAIINFRNIEEYSNFVRKIYKTDDIAPWKIEKKLTYMIGKDYCVKIVWIEQLYNQSYIRKKDNNHLYSAELYKIKTSIRSQYCSKITNYFYDIICHIGDNPDQNILINKIISEYSKNK